MWSFFHLSTCICIRKCKLYVSRKSSVDLKLEFRRTYSKYDIEYTVHFNLCEIRILNNMLHMCSLLNCGFVNAVATFLFCIVFVLFGKTVPLYCYANKVFNLESLYQNLMMYLGYQFEVCHENALVTTDVTTTTPDKRYRTFERFSANKLSNIWQSAVKLAKRHLLVIPTENHRYTHHSYSAANRMSYFELTPQLYSLSPHVILIKSVFNFW